MSAEFTPIPSISATTDNTSTHTRLSGNRLWLAWLVWGILSVLTVVLFLASMPARWDELHRISAVPQPTNFWTQILPPLTMDDVELLAQIGLSVDFYAGYAIAVGFTFAVGCLATGIILIWRRSHDWLALFVSVTFILCAVYFPPSIPLVLSLQKAQPSLYLVVQFMIGIGFATEVPVWFIFPDGRFVPSWTRWVATFWVLWMLLGIVLPAISLPRLSAPAFFVVIGIEAVALNYIQVYRYRLVSNPIQRQQTKWLVLCLIIVGVTFIVGNIIVIAFPFLSQPGVSNIIYRLVSAFLFLIIYLSVPFGVTLAVLRYRLWDVDLPINRSVVYGLVSILLVACFFILFWVTQAVLAAVLGSEQNMAAGALATAVTIWLFNPTRNRIQKIIDRNVYGLRFDLNQLVSAQKLPEVKNQGALTGKTIGGYQVLGVLGKGGMGEVYQGHINGQSVALKILPEDLAQQSEFVSRFEREAATMRALNHPHIVKLLAAGEQDGVRYLALEYIAGADLSNYLKNNGKLSYNDARILLRDLAAALDYAPTKDLSTAT
jgi:Protein kinase domain